jgi:hypothetical protein
MNSFWISDIGIDSDVISEPFQCRNVSFQSDIFSSDIGITDVDVGCRISPTLRSMSMPTYAIYSMQVLALYTHKHELRYPQFMSNFFLAWRN